MIDVKQLDGLMDIARRIEIAAERSRRLGWCRASGREGSELTVLGAG